MSVGIKAGLTCSNGKHPNENEALDDDKH